MSEFLARYGDNEHVKSALNSDPHSFEIPNAAAKNPIIDANTLLKIHTTASSSNARHMAAAHKNFPAEMIDVIDHRQYKEAVATNPNTSGKTLEKLHNMLNLHRETMGHTNSHIRSLIAQHPNLPQNMQEKFLALKPTDNIERDRILRNPNLHQDLIRKHWNSMHHDDVYRGQEDSDIDDILRNKNTPIDVLHNAADRYHQALQNPSLPHKVKRRIIDSGTSTQRFLMAGNPSLSKHEFDEIVYHQHQYDPGVQATPNSAMKRHYPNDDYDSRKNSYKPY